MDDSKQEQLAAANALLNGMPYADFVTNLTTQVYYLPGTQDTRDLFHSIIGIVTEAGELLDIVKKQYAYGKPFDVTNCLEEFGDVLFYMQLGLNALNALQHTRDPVWLWTIDDVIAMNKRKLQVRYEKNKELKFSQEAALNRDLEQERETLEGSANGETQIS